LQSQLYNSTSFNFDNDNDWGALCALCDVTPHRSPDAH
jgi:hypothetical protein